MDSAACGTGDVKFSNTDESTNDRSGKMQSCSSDTSANNERTQCEFMEISLENEVNPENDGKRDKYDNIDETLKRETSRADISVEATVTRQDGQHGRSSFRDNEANVHADQGKIKRSISRGQTHANVSIEWSGDSSDEDSSKRQKLNKSAHDTGTENASDDTITFQRTKSKVKQRNYRKRQNVTSDNEDSSANILSNETTREAFDTNEANVASASTRNESPGHNDSLKLMHPHGSESLQEDMEVANDGSEWDKNERGDLNEWSTASEDEWDENDDIRVTRCLGIKKPSPNWCIVPEIVNRQIGSNPLFQRRFYGSLHAVERLELMYKLEYHGGCVNALNFNQNGNLLVSASDDLTVVIWDWATGKMRKCISSQHVRNIFQAKWLPLSNPERLVATCARDGQVRVLNVESCVSSRLATHRGPSHKLAVHPETPHLILSAGEDARVFSIDIRETNVNKLLVVKEGTMEVQLYSIHFNPFNSNEFCVGGRSRYVKLYDRRKVSRPLYKLRPSHMTENSTAHVTCAVYNYDGTEILASYNDEDIYLFDKITSSSADVDSVHKYQGHRNSATVKGVNFFGPKSEYVVSGSDCGNIFIWDKNTEAIVQWMEGDQQGVVNCLEGHPHIPILATSGLDYDVKIWVPSCEKSPTMRSLATCIKDNVRNRRKEENGPSMFNGHLFWMLLRHIRFADRRNTYSLYTNRHRAEGERGNEQNNEGDNNNDDDDNDNDEDNDDDDDDDDDTDDNGDDNDNDDDDDDYYFNNSSNDDLSENSDSQSESSDVGRIQCP